MDYLVLLLGGNLGDTKSVFQACRVKLQDLLGPEIAASSVYKSPSWGFESHDFLNQLLVFPYQEDIRQTLVQLLKIESSLGRIREGNSYMARVLDIDVIFNGNQRIEEPEITIPHPRFHLRRFCLVPLLEVLPEASDPGSGLMLYELLQRCEDQAMVEKLEETNE